MFSGARRRRAKPLWQRTPWRTSSRCVAGAIHGSRPRRLGGRSRAVAKNFGGDMGVEDVLVVGGIVLMVAGAWVGYGGALAAIIGGGVLLLLGLALALRRT